MFLLSVVGCLALREMEADLEALEQQLEDLEDQNGELEDQVSDLEDDNADLASELDELEAGLDDTAAPQDRREPTVIYAKTETRLSSGYSNVDYAWALDGDWDAARVTVWEYSRTAGAYTFQTSEDTCGEGSWNTEAGYNMYVVEAWLDGEYFCWATDSIGVTGCFVGFIRVDVVTCE